MNSSLAIDRTFIPFGFRLEFEVRTPCDPLKVKELASSTLEHCIPPSLLRQGELRDIKGRDPNLVLLSSTPTKLKPSGHELLFLHGTAPVNVLEPEESADDSSEIDEWTFAIQTPFKEFEGTHHIKHQVVPKFDLFDRDQLLQALESEATKTSLFRFGFDIFRSQRFLAMIGFIPSSVRTVLIEADERELRFKIFAEELKRRDESPFLLIKECALWPALNSALIECGGFNLEESYQLALSEQ